MISYDLIKDVFDLDNPLTLEYFELCSKDTEEPKYFEKHHILPKSMWGEFRLSTWNLVRLTYQDHYRVHEILPFICLQSAHKIKMSRTWGFMRRVKGDKIVVTKEVYSELRSLYKDATYGENNYMYGKKHTPETKLKISVANTNPSEETRKKLAEGRIGKTWSLEAKQKMSDDRKGEKNYNFGKPRSDETKRKLSEFNTGVRLSDETKKKISEAMKGEKNPFFGKEHSSETKLKLSLAHTGKTLTAEHRKNLSLAGKGKPHSKEHTRKIAEARKIPLDEFLQFLHSNTNLELVGEYDGVSKKTVFKCNKGHPEFLRTPYHVKTGRVCNHCKKELREAETQTPQR